MKNHNEFMAKVYDRYEHKKRNRRKRLKITASVCMMFMINAGIFIHMVLTGAFSTTNESAPNKPEGTDGIVINGEVTTSGSAFENITFGGDEKTEDEKISGNDISEATTTETTAEFAVLISVISKEKSWTVSSAEEVAYLCEYFDRNYDFLKYDEEMTESIMNTAGYVYRIEITLNSGVMIRYFSVETLPELEQMLDFYTEN